MFLEAIFITFVLMFSAYFVFHCLNMFSVEKQGVRVFCDSLVTHENFRDSPHNSPVAKP